MQIFLQAGYMQFTPQRLFAIASTVVALISVIIALRARARKSPALVSIILGFTAVILSIVHLALTTGGFGTGQGRAGAIVALVIGLTGMLLGWRAWARYQK